MHFKLIIAFVEDDKTDSVMKAAREAGATGCTVVTSARGEGSERPKTFFGMNLVTARDVLMFLVEEHMSRVILEHINSVAGFEQTPGRGIAFQVDVEDAIGVTHQIQQLKGVVEEKL